MISEMVDILMYTGMGLVALAIAVGLVAWVKSARIAGWKSILPLRLIYSENDLWLKVKAATRPWSKWAMALLLAGILFIISGVAAAFFV